MKESEHFVLTNIRTRSMMNSQCESEAANVKFSSDPGIFWSGWQTGDRAETSSTTNHLIPHFTTSQAAQY